MTATLAELLNAQTPEQIFASLIGLYSKNGFPVQSWQPFGTERTRAMAMATVLNDISANYVPQITAGGFLDYAAALPIPDWLQILAAQLFDVQFNPAGFTVGTMVLTATNAGPYTIHDGDLITTFAASGNRYISNGNGTQTLAHNGTLPLFFVSEFTGAKYNDPNSSAISLVTSLPGVTVTNPANTYSSVSHIGSGIGTLTLSGSPTIAHQVLVRIDATGSATTATWSYSLDSGPFVSVGAASSYTISGTSITVTLIGALSPDFIEADTYLFNTPGSWISSQGSDVESNAALAQRCHNRWSSLSPIPVSNFYELLVTSTPNVGSQVTQVKVFNDTVINNLTHIIVAGPAGVLSGGVISTIQSYVNARVPITDYPVVGSPSQLPITIVVATVTVSAAQLTAATNAINTALIDYVDGIGINGTIRYAAVIELIMNVLGVIDVSGVTINGSAANKVLGSATTFVIAQPPTLTIGYVTV